MNDAILIIIFHFVHLIISIQFFDQNLNDNQRFQIFTTQICINIVNISSHYINIVNNEIIYSQKKTFEKKNDINVELSKYFVLRFVIHCFSF